MTIELDSAAARIGPDIGGFGRSGQIYAGNFPRNVEVSPP
jgi:hypothetical protein